LKWWSTVKYCRLSTLESINLFTDLIPLYRVNEKMEPNSTYFKRLPHKYDGQNNKEKALELRPR